MPFEIRVNGETAWTTDHQVERVSLQSARGEAGTIGISTEGVVDIIVTEVASGGPRRLDHVEAENRRLDRERVGEGDRMGGLDPRSYNIPRDSLRTQGEHDYTLRPGGPNQDQQEPVNIPDRDLAAGIDSSDTDSLTTRVNAFKGGQQAGEILENDEGANSADQAGARRVEATNAHREFSLTGNTQGGGQSNTEDDNPPQETPETETEASVNENDSPTPAKAPAAKKR